MIACLRFRSWLPAVLAPVLLAAILGSVRSGPSGNAETWPMLGGTPQHNAVTTSAQHLPGDWSVEEGKLKNIKWVAETGTRGYSSPVIAGGKVFISTNNGTPRDPKVEGPHAVLMCFQESDGKFLWQIVHDMPPDKVVREAGEDGLLSTPTVEGDHLYYVTPGCEVVCADTDGKIVWRRDLMKELGVFPCYVANCSPVVAGGLVLVVTDNGRDADDKLPAPKAPSFVALDKKTGEVRWQDNSPGDKILEGQWGSPAYAEVEGKGQAIFPGGDGWLYAFEPTSGKLLWKFDCNAKQSEYKPESGRPTRHYLVATPVVHEGKVYIGTGRQPDDSDAASAPGNLWCVAITRQGDVSPVQDNFDPKAAVNKSSALVWNFGAGRREKSGRRPVFGTTISSPVIHEGLLYTADLPGFFYCLDAATGEKYWEHDLKAAVWGSPAYIDGKIYLGTDNGEVFIFPHGKEKNESAIHSVDMMAQIKCPVVAVNGVLYVRTDTHLYAIAKP